MVLPPHLFLIDLNYIKYPWNYDNRIQYNINESDSYNKRRPYIGIVFKIGDFKLLRENV